MACAHRWEQTRRNYVDQFDFRAGLSQDVLSSSNSGQQQALQTISAFQTLQALFQNSATSSGSTLAGNSQLFKDLSALGSALSSGDVTTAQSAFATVLGDLKNSASAAQVNEATAASQSVQLVEGLLGPLNSSPGSSTLTDTTTSLLQSVYAGNGGLNVLA